MRHALLVATALAVLGVAAHAADFDVRPGDRIKGVLAPGGGGDRISFDTAAGAELTVKLKGSNGLLPGLRLLDPDGDDVVLAIAISSGGRKVKVSGQTLSRTGQHTLLVFGQGDTGGSYKLSLAVDLPSRVKTTSESVASEQEATFEMSAFAGTVAKITVSRGGDGKAEPEVVSLVGPSGPVALPAAIVKTGKVKLTGVMLPDDGTYALTARPRSGTSGSLKVKFSLAPPRSKVTHVRRDASISGSILVPEPEPDVIFEQEPNDTILGAQFIGPLAPGTSYAIAGISDALYLDYDVFRFVVTRSTRFEVALGLLDATYDFDAYVYTYDPDGTPRLRLVLDSGLTIESGSFDLSVGIGDYEVVDVVIEPWAGYGIYVLGVGGSEFGAGGLTVGTANLADDAGSRHGKGRRRRTAMNRHFRPFAAEFRTDCIVVERREGAIARGSRRARRERVATSRVDGDERERRLRIIGQCVRAGASEGVFDASPVYRLRASTVPDDDLFNRQWHYRMIDLPSAWEVTTGDEDVVVAVLDTGVRPTHPDLAANLTDTGYDFVSDLVSAADGDGRDDDPTDPGDGAGVEPSSYHGTHVAGTVAAVTDNGRGVAGVAWNVKVMAVRVLGVGGGDVDDIAEAIRYAAGLPNASGRVPDRPARVINMSLGGETLDDRAPTALAAAVRDATAAGVLVVCAAGNASSSRPSWPAAIPECLSVSAVNAEAEAAYYSNRGSTVDLAAPGGETGVDRDGDGHDDGVLSTFWDEATGRPDYRLYQGTSMAAPHVAGVAALALSVDPTLSVAALRGILEDSATDLGAAGRDDVYGHGLVNARAAVLRAGTAGAGPATLTLSRTTVHFGRNETEQKVLLGNSGGGSLTITSVTDVEEDGGDWLSASLGTTSTPSTLTLTAARTGLAAGSHRATVTITSTAGNATVQVSLEIGGTEVPDVGTIGFFVIDPWLGLVVADAETTALASYAYGLDLPPGAYLLVAASDDDANGVFGEEGELLGAWPVLSAANILFLEGGEHLTGLDFAVSRNEDLEFARFAFSKR